MIEQLFGSKTRVKLLQLFLTNPNRPFYVREITRKIDEQINSVRRELANLLSIGIITSDNTNNRLYYEVNQKYKYHDALAAIFGGKKLNVSNSSSKSKTAIKTTKAEKESASDEKVIVNNPIAEQIKKAGNVRLLILTGQFTRDNSSGVDLLIVGDMNMIQTEKAISDIEKTESKEIKFAVFKPQEFIYRKQIHDKFVVNVLDSKNQVLIDEDRVLK